MSERFASAILELLVGIWTQIYVKNLLSISSLVAVLLPVVAAAQELPRPSLVHTGEEHKLPTDYNMKVGPVLFNFNSSLEGDYIDNIALTHNDTKSDFLLTPEVGMTVSWPVTETNTLSLNTSLGYTKYLIHPQYDTSHILVAPDSSLAFNIYTGNFKINIHDDFSYQQDPVNEGALSNIVTFDRFENIAGVGVLWDLNRAVLTLNYDHINFISTDLQDSSGADVPDPGALTYSADQFSASAEFHLSSTLVGGLEGVVSRRTYDQSPGDYDTYSAGPFMRVQITQYIKAELSGGYKHIDSPDSFLTPAAIGVLQPTSGAGSNDSYYADLTLDHEVNKYYVQRFSIGHDLELGLLGDQSEVSYLNYTSSWHVNTHLNLALTLSYQNVDEVGGLFGVSSYNFLGAGLQASFPVTRSLSGSVIYQFNDKLADSSDQGYLQNRLGFILTYHF